MKNMHFYIDNGDDLGWLLVLGKHSKLWVEFALSLECQWEAKEKCYGIYKDQIASYLTYGILDSYKNSEMKELKGRWHQLCRALV